MEKDSKTKKITSIAELPEYDKIEQFEDTDVFYCSLNDVKSPFIVHFEDMNNALKMYRVKISPQDRHGCKIIEAEYNVITTLKEDLSGDNENGEEGEKSQSAYQRDLLNLISEAVRQKVTDVHLEIRDKKATIKFRLNGKLSVVRVWDKNHGNRVCSVAFTVMAKELEGVVFNPREPQFAVMEERVDGVQVRLRMNSIPAAPDGYDVVIRILKVSLESNESGTMDLGTLGYSPEHVSILQRAMGKKSGGVIISGTTGSGKSTTLQQMLKNEIIEKPFLKLITIEDPPEYFIEGATQVPVARKEGKNEFAETIKACMRCDPDVIMIGEIRDPVTTELFTDAVLTGHKTLSTVHAKSALSVVSRFERMGADLQTLTSKDFFSALIFQTLVSVTCPHCKLAINSQEAFSIIEKRFHNRAKEKIDGWLDVLKRVARINGSAFNEDNIFVHNPEGCDHCSFGAVGSTVLAEVITPSQDIMNYLMKKDQYGAWESWVVNGGKSILQHACAKIMEGDVCPVNAEWAVGTITDAQEELDIIENSQHPTPKGGGSLGVFDEK